MESIALVQKLLLTIILTLSFLLGIVILLANKKSKTNIFYFFTALTIIGWVLFGFMVYYEPVSNYRLLMGRLNFFSVALWFVSIYAFILNFPTEQKKWTLFNISFIFSGIILAAISLFSPYIIEDIHIDKDSRVWTFGPIIVAYYAYAILTALIMILRLIHSYKNESPKNRIKVGYFVAGIISVLVFNIIFNVIYPYIVGNSNYYFLGDFSVIFILGFTAYAIVKHQLFNIKVIATETTVILISIGLIIEVFTSTNVTEGSLKGIVWILATYAGYALIKSVKTEIKQKEKLGVLARKLEQANDHLKELDETKDNFLSMAAHELNTPIADEKLCGPINKDATKYLEQIYGSSKRLANLVKDLLNVSRIESNRIHIIYSQAQMEDVIKQSIGEVAIKAKEAGHKLSFEQPSHKLPQTWMDVPRITEVLINFLGNSIKYTEPPGKIVVRAHADDGKIVVAVEDNGRGIPKDKYNHIFEKFTQVNVLKDEVKGTGLGMFISKNLIGMHKGKIWFKSSVDQDDHGTTFYFSIPVVKNKPYDPHENEGALFALKPASKEDTEKIKAELDKELGKEKSEEKELRTESLELSDKGKDSKELRTESLEPGKEIKNKEQEKKELGTKS